MACYLGVDAGTTNTKVLVLFEDGSTRIAKSFPTPKYTRDGAEYFSLDAIETGVLTAIHQVKRDHEIAGIGFSSIGESVVPIDENGGTLGDPLTWYDTSTIPTARGLEHRSTLFPYTRRGLHPEHTLGVFKMLWMKEHRPRIASAAAAGTMKWLPVSSYLPFRWCGLQRWDYSQAARSFLLDIHHRQWDENALAALGLTGELPEVHSMGSPLAGTPEGIPLYLGGHDHIVGMNGVRILFGMGTLYASIGSAFVLGGTAVIGTRAMTAMIQEFDDLIAGAASQPGAYYIENSMRYCGTLLASVARITGESEPGAYYSRINDQLMENPIPENPALFLAEGDRFIRQSKTGFQIIDIPLQVTPSFLVWSLYLYLVLNARTILDELSGLFDASRLIVGGGPARNPLLMQLLADGLGIPLTLLDQSELSALGAALTAAEGAGDSQVIQNTLISLDTRVIEPGHRSPEIRRHLHRLSERISAYLEKTAHVYNHEHNKNR